MERMLNGTELCDDDEEDEDYVPEEEGRRKRTRVKDQAAGLRLEGEEQAERSARRPENEIGTVSDEKVKKVEVDELWKEMNRPMKSGKTSSKGIALKKPKKVVDPLALWLDSSSVKEKETSPSGSGVQKVERGHQHDGSQLSIEDEASQKSGDLQGLLKTLKGKQGSVFSKTKEDWISFKKEANVEEELEAHRKDKDRYTEKVSFLERANVREWEYERRGKHR